MSLGSFLKTLGQDVVKAFSIAAEIVLGFGPVLSSVDPKAAPVVAIVTSDFQRIFGIVQNVEVMGAALSTPLAGPDKLKAAAPIMGQEVLKILDALGLKVADQNGFAAAVTGLTSVTADLLNSVKPK